VAFNNPETALESDDYLHIARRLLKLWSPQYPKMSTVWNLYGEWWKYEWSGKGKKMGVWKRLSVEQMDNHVRRFMEGALVRTGREDEQGEPVLTRYKMCIRHVREILAAMKSLVWFENEQTPIWLRREGEEIPSDPNWTIAFKDKLVDVRKSAEKGEFVTMDRTPKWFDLTYVPVQFEVGYGCPLWKRCLEEWGNGDEGWGELLQKWFGYCLMAERRYAKILLMHGSSRAGKGVISGVLQKLMSREVIRSPRALDLTGAHALEGFEHSRLLVLPEWTEMDQKGQSIVAGLMKNIVGQDWVSINPKGRTIRHNVKLGCAPMIQANEYPILNDNRGAFSIKVVILPFTKNMLEEGKVDDHLDEKLEKELPGIAAWAVEGAMKLWACESKDRWKMTPKGEERMKEFRALLNPIDTFLQARFVKSATSFVPLEMLRREWEIWKDQNKCPMKIHDNQLAVTVVEKSSWNLQRGRIHEGQRVVRGLALARLKGYEV